MNQPQKKPIIGILGGIASGKSTIAAALANLGCKVIDADSIAHELLEEPKIKKKIVDLFGSSVVESNKINRKKLADIVFAETDKLVQLNNIIHPAVLKRTEQLIGQFYCQPEVKAIVLDMPLLLEVGWEKRCDKLIFVDCKAELRAERAKKMGFFEQNQLKFRENLQISLDKKKILAENTIDNNSDLSALKNQVADFFSNMKYNG